MTHSPEWPCLLGAVCVFINVSQQPACETHWGKSWCQSHCLVFLSASLTLSVSFFPPFTLSFTLQGLQTVCSPFCWPSSTFKRGLRMDGEGKCETERLNVNERESLSETDWWTQTTQDRRRMKDCIGVVCVSVRREWLLTKAYFLHHLPAFPHTIPQIHPINLQWKGSPA